MSDVRESVKPLRLMFYDATCRGRFGLPGLSHSWWIGGYLYQMLGRLDAFVGVTSWDEALDWLTTYQAGRPIGEIQYWGHGHWGCVYIDRIPLGISALQTAHPWFPALTRIQSRMSDPSALWWFRTCETFGAVAGHQFAMAFSDFMGCRVAGHTFIIGPWQSGLHCLLPGHLPDWDVSEGLALGSPERPQQALWSGPSKPHTIHCLNGHIPPEWHS